MPVTLEDVAQAAGVSVATVSRVLGGGKYSDRISETTRRRVRAAARRVGYRVHRVAQSLRKGKTLTIGLVVPRLETRMTAEFVNGVEHVCERHGYRVLFGYSHHDAAVETAQVELLLQHRVEGMVVYLSARGGCEWREWIEKARQEGVPFVVVREKPANPSVHYVTSDFTGGAWQAVTHLISLGHRRIGHLSGQQDTASAVWRLEGYKKALLNAGIEPDETLVAGGRLSEESAAQGMRQLLDLADPPTAVFAANDLLAVAAMKVIRDAGLRVPADIAVVGFGNWYWSEAIGLTTVEENCQEIGRQAALRLFKLLKNPDMPPEGIILPTRLLVRASCGSDPDFVPLVTGARLDRGLGTTRLHDKHEPGGGKFDVENA